MTDGGTWLLLVHHLPPRPTRLRVRVWRQLQKLGAATVKNSVYVLPWSDRHLEDFTWLNQEIVSGGGEAAVFRASAVAGSTDAEIVAAFRRDRDAVYARITSGLLRVAQRMEGRRRDDVPAPGTLEAFDTEVDAMQTELNHVEGVDFFKAPGRARAAAAMEKCRTLLRRAQGRKPAARPATAGKATPRDRARYQGRLWVTRPRPHIDRCASAWLIRKFIDRRPRFGFAVRGGALRGGIPFDMPEAELGHQGEDCTFETLVKQFGLERDAAVRLIAQIVHDVDLKDGKFGRPEAAGVDAVLRGLSEQVHDDQRLLREAGAVFDGLYATLAVRPAGTRKTPMKRRV